jgi:multidrug resistance efflux pump
MLNISDNKLKNRIPQKDFTSLVRVESKKATNLLLKLSIAISVFVILIMFIPWTQNIRARGLVSALKPSEKPQVINSIIAGKIQEWYFQEGDFALEGDTILKLSEVKDAYLNPNLLRNTEKQIALKVNSVEAYKEKIIAQKEQLQLVKSQKQIKIEQAKNKVQNDSTEYIAALTNYKNATNQLVRMDSLYKLGFMSLTDLEKRTVNQQKANAYRIEANNKWLNSKLDVANTKAYYSNLIAKLNSDIFSTQSIQLDAETELNKLQNQFGNYSIRNNQYYVLMPQDGYITQIYNSGIGEIIKEGDALLNIMPDRTNLVVELFINPVDLPLLQTEQKVRIQFDGWPAIIFSGWPNASYGTYGGAIYAIDRNVTQDGKFRILVQQDSTEYAWPDALRYGEGASNMIMLNNVPIWYELWRNINGFPADYYVKKTVKAEKNE